MVLLARGAVVFRLYSARVPLVFLLFLYSAYTSVVFLSTSTGDSGAPSVARSVPNAVSGAWVAHAVLAAALGIRLTER